MDNWQSTFLGLKQLPWYRLRCSAIWEPSLRLRPANVAVRQMRLRWPR